MLLWFAERMLGTLLKCDLVWLVSSLPLLESPRVSEVFESPISSKSERWSICPRPFPPRKCPAHVLASKTLQMGKGRKRVTSAPVEVKSRFEFVDESVVLPRGRRVYSVDPNFAFALRDEGKTASSRQNGRSCHAAPAFQSSPR